MRPALRHTLLFLVGFSGPFAAIVWPRWSAIRDGIADLADTHVQHDVAHPGWSFPAQLWSAPAPLSLPPARQILHAKARSYTAACPPEEPGEYCEDTGEVIPRGGRFPEGIQPPGVEGWTRPVAMEPVLIGTLVGPDAEIREHLPLADAPVELIAAIVAAEDQYFYDHAGVNLRGVLRATWNNLLSGGYQQGASTLTMQMVRNLTQLRERTFRRKLLEAAKALALDAHIGKDGVLQMYLDAPYLGQLGSYSICGFQAASRHYWGVPIHDLSLAQVATLAAILPAPGRFSPVTNPAEATSRRDVVLRRMAKAGWNVTAALEEPVEAGIHPQLPPARHPAYLQAARAWLEATLPLHVVYGSGLDVYTAMDVVAQEAGEAEIPAKLALLTDLVGHNNENQLEVAAALVEVESGLLAASYGGTIQMATDFNRATQARRQAGSSIKPLVYALAFDQTNATGLPRYTAASILPNAPRSFEGTNGWSPRNVGGEYTEFTTLAMGLTWSQNIATASLLEELGGPSKMIFFADRLGFETRNWPLEMGLALGQAEVTPLEMARFVGTVINSGRLASGRPVVTALDAANQVRVPPPDPGRYVLTIETAALTRDLMRMVVTNGTGGRSRGTGGIPGYIGPAIGKTGTTDSEKDLWFVGGTPKYAGAVWLGYDRPARIGASASDMAAPMWGWWMRAAHAGLEVEDFNEFPLPHRAICTVSGKRSNGGCRVLSMPFLDGTQPRAICPMEHSLRVRNNEQFQGIWSQQG